MCLLIDPRTHLLFCQRNWSTEETKIAYGLLQQLYVDFFLNVERATADFTIPNASSSDDDENLVLYATSATEQREQRLTMEQWENMKRRELKGRFRKEYLSYSTFLLNFDWKTYANEQGVTGVPAVKSEIDPLQHLMNVNLMPMIRTMPAQLKYFQLLLTHSRAFVASLPAASYAERINSAAGTVCTKGNVLLNTDHISHLVPLRMNKEFFGLLCHKLLAHEIS